MRNLEKDAAEMAERRDAILEAGFRLFSEKNIEPVSMNEVAKTAGVGIATLYRYYNTKSDLVIAVGTRVWDTYTREQYQKFAETETEETTAAEEFEFYLESFLDLYRNHRDILRFNQFFNIYLQSEKKSRMQTAPYMEIVGVLEDRFNQMYQKALCDGTLRTDIPEKKIFYTTIHLMLAAVTRYAVGLVYTEETDPEEELQLLKDLLLTKFSVHSGDSDGREQGVLCHASER